MISTFAAAALGCSVAAVPPQAFPPQGSFTLRLEQPGFIDLNQRDPFRGGSSSGVDEGGKKGTARWVWPTTIGGILLAGGAATWGVAWNTDRQLRFGDPSINSRAALNEAVARGQLLEKIGWAGMGLGIAGLGTGALFYFLDRPASASVALTPTSNGGVVVFSGRLP